MLAFAKRAQDARMNARAEKPEPQTSGRRRWFTDFANVASHAAGRATTFALAVFVIVVWAITGPIFGFSDTWQLIINTGTTIITFLMVFLIQNSQNRDSAAIQVKLDELIRTGHVRNTFVGIEHLTDDELEALRKTTEARAANEGGARAMRRIGDKARRAADDVSHG
jgi:low affinity Fe/Cu permease